MKKVREVEARRTPVSNAFHDQVIFLKHNLNARAIASLQKTSMEMDKEVDRLQPARGLRQRSRLNLPKSLSVEHNSAPCSIASAAR